jgi:hypothetical protein
MPKINLKLISWLLLLITDTLLSQTINHSNSKINGISIWSDVIPRTSKDYGFVKKNKC